MRKVEAQARQAVPTIAVALAAVLLAGVVTVVVRSARTGPVSGSGPSTPPPPVTATCGTSRVTLLVGQQLVLGCAVRDTAAVPQQATVTQLDQARFVAVRPGPATVTLDRGCPAGSICTQLQVRVSLAVTVVPAAPLRAPCRSGPARLVPGQTLVLDCPAGDTVLVTQPDVLAPRTPLSFVALAPGSTGLELLAPTTCQQQIGATCPAIGVSPGSVAVTVVPATS